MPIFSNVSEGHGHWFGSFHNGWSSSKTYGFTRLPFDHLMLSHKMIHSFPLGFGHVHAAQFRFPFVDAGIANVMLTAKLRDWIARLMLFNIAMIYLSEKRLRFILWPSQQARANFDMD